MTVFGPLKKLWNSAIDEFKSTYKVAVTKHYFLQVFDPAWKKCTEKKHSISGFRATGLVPFNPDKVDYRKVLSRPSSVKPKNDAPVRTTTSSERLGITMAFQTIKGILSAEQVAQFDKRIENDYNIVDETDQNKLWRVYKTVKIMQMSNNAPSAEVDSTSIESSSGDPDTIIDHSLNPAEDLEDPFQCCINIVDETSIVTQTSIESVEKQAFSTPKKNDLSDLPDINVEAGPSTSCEVQLNSSYVNFDYSPFKQYLKISDNTIVQSKKVPKRKPKTPSAISGKDYIANLRQAQEKKEKELKEKEQRKQLREEKRKMKTTDATKKIMEKQFSDGDSTVEEDVIQEEMVFASSDEDELFDVEQNMCGACEGSEDWKEGYKWVGCNKCIRWFHKSCLSKNIEEMTPMQLKTYEFICNVCQKMSKKHKK